MCSHNCPLLTNSNTLSAWSITLQPSGSISLVVLCLVKFSSATMLQVEKVTQATLTHRQWHLNHYHSMTESAFEVYNLACKVFQLCNLHTKEDFVPVFLDRAGVAGWDTRLGDSGGHWGAVLPPAAEALQCYYPKPAIWIADAALRSKVKTSIAGCHTQ